MRIGARFASPVATLAVLVILFGATGAFAQRGGFAGTSGGGMRPTGSSSAGFNRAGTASSGGFAYGDAPRESASSAAKDAAPPCKVDPVVVSMKQYYKCPDGWYIPALTDAGLTYRSSKPPPGY
jgi:hypothetical protein